MKKTKHCQQNVRICYRVYFTQLPTFMCNIQNNINRYNTGIFTVEIKSTVIAPVCSLFVKDFLYTIQVDSTTVWNACHAFGLLNH